MKKSYFDIDETLFFTTAKIIVKNTITGEEKELDNKAYRNYIIKSDEIFDFTEFSCARTFASTSTPNPYLIRKVISEFKAGHIVDFLTARHSLDFKDVLLDYMKSYGLPVGHRDDGLIHIIRAGDLPGYDNPQKKKSIVRNELYNNDDITELELYDDDKNNLKAFMELKNEFPNKTFSAFLVKESEILSFA